LLPYLGVKTLQLGDLVSSIGALAFNFGEEAVDLLTQRFIVCVDLFTVGIEADRVLACFVFVDGVVVALVEGATFVLRCLRVLDEPGDPHLALGGLVLCDGEVHPDIDDDSQEE